MDKRYQEFLELFHSKRDYFQCHEILEEIWVEETGCSTKDHPAIVLLQFSVALLHWERKNLTGALRLFNSSLKHLKKCQNELEHLGINSRKLESDMERAVCELEECQAYHEIDVPLNLKK